MHSRRPIPIRQLRAHSFLGVVALVLTNIAACAARWGIVATNGQHFTWDAMNEAVKANSKADLGCPPDQVTVTNLGKQELLANGCGLRGLYRYIQAPSASDDAITFKLVLISRFSTNLPSP